MPLLENMCATSCTSGDDCSGAVEWWRAGSIAPKVDVKSDGEPYQLGDVNKAFEDIMARRTKGKVVLKI